MSQFTAAEQRLIDIWEAHTAAEFELKDADAAVATMTDDASLTHVPSGTGATGKEAIREFYANTFIPQWPDDVQLQVVTRSVGQGRVIDEFVVHLTHTVRMDWFAPGIEPTGRKLIVPHVGVVTFRGELMVTEHIYWDQGTVLRQLGVIDDSLPVMGQDQADRLLDPSAPANRLIERL